MPVSVVHLYIIYAYIRYISNHTGLHIIEIDEQQKASVQFSLDCIDR